MNGVIYSNDQQYRNIGGYMVASAGQEDDNEV